MDHFFAAGPLIEIHISQRTYLIPDNIITDYLSNFPLETPIDAVEQLPRSFDDAVTREALQILFKHLSDIANDVSNATLLTSLEELYRKSVHQRNYHGQHQKHDIIFIRLGRIFTAFGAHPDLYYPLSTFFVRHADSLLSRGSKIVAQYLQVLGCADSVPPEVLTYVALHPSIAEHVLEHLRKMCLNSCNVNEQMMEDLKYLVDQQDERALAQVRRGIGEVRVRLANGAQYSRKRLMRIAMHHPERLQIRRTAVRGDLEYYDDEDDMELLDDIDMGQFMVPRRRGRRERRMRQLEL